MIKCIHSHNNVCIHPLLSKDCEGLEKDCHSYECMNILDLPQQDKINQAYKKGYEDGYKKAESQYNYNKR